MDRLLIWILVLAGSIYLTDPDTSRYMVWCGFLLLALMLRERR